MADVSVTPRQTSWNSAFLGWLFALYSTVSSSTIAALMRGLILEGISPSQLLLLRLWISIVLLGLTVAAIDWRKLLLGSRGLRFVTFVGLISGVEICIFSSSLAHMDASMVSMLKSTQPLVVIILLRLGGETLRIRDLIRVALALVGVYFLIGPDGQTSPVGLLLVGASIVLYSVQLVFVQWYLKDLDSQAVTTYLLAWMALVSLVWWWLEGARWQEPSSQGWLIIIILAVFTTYLARLATYAAIPRIGSGQVSLLWPLQMFLAVVFSVMLLAESLSWLQWFGGLLILLSAVLAIEHMRFLFGFRRFQFWDSS